jgi:hypothetical protein
MARFRVLAMSLSILSILTLSTPASAAPPDRITGPIVAGQSIRLAHGVPAQTRLASDEGPVESSMKLNGLTLLTVPSPAQQRALTKLLADQQNPHSASYHKWLKPIQYADRFGLSSNDLNKIAAWLQSQGFTVTGTARARNWIRFSGTAAQVERTFATEIHNFTANGESHFANTTPISIPSALSGIVTGIRGLNNFPLKSNLARRSPAYTTSNGNLFLAPGDIATIYDFSTLIQNGTDGSGVTLAVIGETDIYLNDLNDFRNGFSLNNAISNCSVNSNNTIKSCTAGNFQYVYADSDSGTDPGSVDSLGDDLPEADLDLEWSNAAARNATLAYVNAPLTGIYTSLYTAIDNADIIGESVITLSYTAPCELAEIGYFDSDEAELQLAASEGVTFINSAGDTGAAECDFGNNLAVYGYAAGYPASSQWTTGVGGTSVPVIDPNEYTDTYWNPSNGSYGGSATGYIPEQAWNDSEEFGLYCPSTSGHSCDIEGVTVTNWSTAQTAIGISAGGGGESNCVTTDDNGVCNSGFPRPSWQSGISETSINPSAFGVTTTPARLTPDVSLLASPNFPGYIVCTADNEIGGSGSTSSCSGGIADALTGCATGNFPCSVFGGTSVASPVFAGIVTLLNQYLVAKGVQSTPGLGPINSTLYTLAASNSTNHAFNSVTTPNTGAYSNGAYCEEGTPSSGIEGDPWPTALVCPSSGANAGFLGFDSYNADTTTSYNLVTGLGSVDVGNLFAAWAGTAVATTTTALQSSENPSNYGDSVTFTATVTTSGSSTPTGSVTFMDGTTTLGTGTLVADPGVVNSATATYPTSTLSSSGSPHSITAVYGGDSNNAGSTSAVLSQVVNPATFTFVSTGPATHSELAGQHSLMYAFTATPTSGSTFAGALTIGCSFLPTDPTLTNASCSYSVNGGAPQTGPITIPAGSGITTVALSVTSAGPNTGTGTEVRHRADNRTPWLPMTLPLAGVVLAGFAGRKRSKYAMAGSLCLALALAGFLIACGSSSNPPVGISVSPSGSTLYPNNTNWPPQTASFTATVSNSTNTGVNWVLSTSASGVSCTAESSPCGTIAVGIGDSVNYNAPTIQTGLPSTVTITATAQADTTKTSASTVTLTPTTVPVNGGYTVTVTATETGAAASATPTVNLMVN